MSREGCVWRKRSVVWVLPQSTVYCPEGMCVYVCVCVCLITNRGNFCVEYGDKRCGCRGGKERTG